MLAIKKVIFSGTFSFPFGDAAGERIKHLAIGMADHVHEVKVVSLYQNDLTETFSPKGYFQLNNHVIKITSIIHRKRFNLSSNYSNRLKARYYQILATRILAETTLSQLSGSNDELLFLYGRSYFFLKIVLSGIKTRGLQTKVLFDVVEPPRLESNWFEYVKHPFTIDSSLVFKKLLIRFDACTFISSKLCQDFGNGLKKQMILPSVLSNIPDRQLTIENVNKPRFVYLGSLYEKDYPELLLRLGTLLEKNKIDFELIIMGRFKNVAEGRKWEEKFRVSTFADKINFINNPDEHLKSQMINTSHFICLFRKPEILQEYTFPTRVVELLSYGKVLVVNSFGDFKNYFHSGENALVIDELKIDEILVQLKQLSDSREYKRISNSSVALLSGPFSASKQAMKLLQLLNN